VSSFGNNRFAVELAAGKNHTCALLNDASISCWGHNGFGSLGVTISGGYSPQNISSEKFRAISAGGFNTCAITSSRKVFCWGRNSLLQIGKQTQTSNVTSPQSFDDISSVEGFVAISTGDNQTCAISTVGDSWCWGSNSDGQLGIGEISDSSIPVATYLLSNWQKVIAVESGGSHSCTLTTQGNLVCWGLNDMGQVGDTGADTSSVPHYLEDTTFTKIATGIRNTCGVRNGGSIVCWGDNESGQSGNNSTLSSSIPVTAQLPAGATAREVATGDSHTCALLDNDDVMCWGSNSKGKLGDGTTTQRLVPTKVLQLRTAPGQSVNSTSDISHNAATINTSFSTVDVSAHRVLEYGTDEFLSGETNSIDLGHFGSVQQIASGSQHSCVVIAGGFAKCWGDNSDGALGTGDQTSRELPVDVKDLSDHARIVAVGRSHSCVAISSGAVKCWGDNSSGQLGDGSFLSKSTPVTVGISDVVDLVLGDGFTCALTVGGTVSCWGTNNEGQLGRTGASTPTPTTVEVDNNHTVTSMSASSSRVCVVLSNATVKCWGDGVTGIASPGTFSSTVASVSVGNSHACATLHNGSVQCWGDDADGQLGNGDTNSSGSLVAVTLGTNDRATAVSVSSGSSCAVLSDGKVKCWGDGSRGVTGFGTSNDTHTPTLVPELEAVVQLSLAELHGCALTQMGEVLCWGSNTRQQRGTSGNAMTVPEMMSSQIHANVSTSLTGLADDQSYFYRVITTSSGGTTNGAIQTFNTTEMPAAPPIDDIPTDAPGETPIDVPADTPTDEPTDAPAGNNPLVDNTPVRDAAPAVETGLPVGKEESKSSVTTVKRVPSVKVGSLTRVRFLLRKLDFSVPSATSETKMWMTVLNKRVCRVYSDRLWAIRKGTCQLMVLKMSPSRRLTMSRTQIKVVR
jgi:alpha-tubulin suppressor-like RCC1 family protein